MLYISVRLDTEGVEVSRDMKYYMSKVSKSIGDHIGSEAKSITGLYYPNSDFQDVYFSLNIYGDEVRSGSGEIHLICHYSNRYSFLSNFIRIRFFHDDESEKAFFERLKQRPIARIVFNYFNTKKLVEECGRELYNLGLVTEGSFIESDMSYSELILEILLSMSSLSRKDIEKIAKTILKDTLWDKLSQTYIINGNKIEISEWMLDEDSNANHFFDDDFVYKTILNDDCIVDIYRIFSTEDNLPIGIGKAIKYLQMTTGKLDIHINTEYDFYREDIHYKRLMVSVVFKKLKKILKDIESKYRESYPTLKDISVSNVEFNLNLGFDSC
jgi:hypothetical protein